MYLQGIVDVCVNRLYYQIVVSDWDLCRTGAGTRYDLRLKHEKSQNDIHQKGIKEK